MFAYSQSYHALSHWKCVLRCCAKFPSINLYDQETDYQYPDTSPSIHFRIYHLISSCNKHGRIPLTDNKSCLKCQHDTDSVQSTKIYTRKELVMMKTTISNFRTIFNIPEIQKLAFHIPHVQILGSNHFGDSHRTAFKRRESFQYLLCRRYYDDRVVYIFNHQIQSEYCGGNTSVSIDVIVL